MMKIGLVQAAACRVLAENMAVLRRFAAAAAEEACQVVCFPECFLTGYAPEEASGLAVCAEDTSMTEISELAGSLAVDILAGFMEREGNAYYITHGVFCKDGRRFFYRKSHLGRRERQFFSPGNALEVFPLSDGRKIGFALCVETHYPDIVQTLALKGAEVIFAPHAVPRVSGDREKIWGKYIPARSYDNRVYMACCNLWDPDRYGGGCLVTGPRGETVAACYREEAALLTCVVDPELPALFRNPENARSQHFYPSLRRKELYD